MKLWTQPMILWQAQYRSLHNSLRHNPQMRIGLLLVTVLGIVSGFWSADQLMLKVQAWQVQGTSAVNAGLWLFCLSVWGSMVFLVVLSVQKALDSEEFILLFTLPLSPSARFRALLGSFFLERLWLWLLFQAVVLGYVLLRTLAWQSLSWLLLLQVGIVLAVCCTLLATLLVMRYIILTNSQKTRIAVLFILGLVLLLLLLYAHQLIMNIEVLGQQLRPDFVLVLFAGCLLLIVGPGAQSAGQLYQQTFLLAQSQDRASHSFTLPGSRALTQLLERRRTLLGGLFVKSLLSQTRNWLFWLRLAVSCGLLILFPSLRSWLSHYKMTDSLLVAGYAGGLAIFQIIETAPGAISGEANRLTLYLAAPFKPSQILYSKLFLFLLPVLSEGLVFGLLLACWSALPPLQLAWSVVAIALLVLGGTTLLVWGSTWDEDINLALEGALETILHEEAPLTARKLLILNACIAFLLVAFLLLWKLPAALSLLALAVLDIVVIVCMHWFSTAQMQRLLRG